MTTLRGAMVAAAVIACQRGSPPMQSAQAPVHAPTVAAATGAPRGAAVPGAVAAVCDTVAERWRATGQAQVRAVDTTALPYHEPDARTGCMVLATAPRGVDSTRWSSLYWADESPAGWTELVEYAADGPDGNTRAYDRALVRCQIDFSQDGGDDSDSTYVPSPAVGETTFCWATRR